MSSNVLPFQPPQWLEWRVICRLFLLIREQPIHRRKLETSLSCSHVVYQLSTAIWSFLWSVVSWDFWDKKDFDNVERFVMNFGTDCAINFRDNALKVFRGGRLRINLRYTCNFRKPLKCLFDLFLNIWIAFTITTFFCNSNRYVHTDHFVFLMTYNVLPF